MTKQFLVLFLLFFIWQASPSSQVQASFCTCDLSNNVNLRHSGSNNRGFVESNNNLKLQTSNCQFNLRSNVDAQITENKSNVDCTSCTQFSIVGHDNKIISRSNVHSHFKGNNNKWDLTSNTGTTIRSTYSVMELRSNKDSNIQGDSANLIATSNTRLRVTGRDFRAVIRSTTDHVFRQVKSGKSGHENELQIHPDLNKRLDKRETGDVKKPTVTIQFVDDAFVDGSNYKIGKFEFSLKPARNGTFELKMTNGTLANSQMESRLLNEKEVVLSATGNGLNHNLRIKGGLITSGSDQTLTLFPKHPNSA